MLIVSLWCGHPACPGTSGTSYSQAVDWEDRGGRIDRSGLRYLWEQIADDLRSLIASGELSPRFRLPTEVELARIYGVTRDTLRRAIQELAGEGLVVVRRSKGMFVATDAAVPRPAPGTQAGPDIW